MQQETINVLMRLVWEQVLDADFWLRRDREARQIQALAVAVLLREVFRLPMPDKCTTRDVRAGVARKGPSNEIHSVHRP
jgi:hypothetical protein